MYFLCRQWLNDGWVYHESLWSQINSWKSHWHYYTKLSFITAISCIDWASISLLPEGRKIISICAKQIFIYNISILLLLLYNFQKLKITILCCLSKVTILCGRIMDHAKKNCVLKLSSVSYGWSLAVLLCHLLLGNFMQKCCMEVNSNFWSQFKQSNRSHDSLYNQALTSALDYDT